MKYTFASLGKLESFGFRIGGAGLGNILFPWARAIVYAKEHNLIRVQTTWRGLKFGTFIRSERDKRLYFDLFTGRDGVSGIRKFLLLNFSNSVKVFSGMNNLFEPFQHQHTFVRSELLKIVNPFHIKKANIFPVDSVAIHIRMGDFRIPKNENILRQGGWNYRLPIKWYKSVISKIVAASNIPIYIFSDVDDADIKDILEIETCQRVFFGSSISDMLALSNAKLLVASGSTFSMWSSFLGQLPTIWFPGQMRQKLISDSSIFEGEIDYEDQLPVSIVKLLNND